MLLNALAALLLAAPARATVLAWPDVEAAALRQSPELASSFALSRSARASYRGSWNGVLPRLGLSNSWSDTESKTDRDSRWGADATASVDLFDVGRYADIRRAAATSSRAAAALRDTSASVRLSLKRAFLDLLFAQESLSVSRRIAAIRGKAADLVRLRYDSGRESLGNRLRAEAQDLQAQAELAQAERDLRTARRALLTRLGREDFEAVTATGTLAGAAAPELPADQAALLRLRPDLAVREAELKQAEAGLTAARSAFYPALSARYGRSVSGPTEFPNKRYGWTAGLTLSLPLFGGGPTAAFEEAVGARWDLESARMSLKAARASALSDIEDAWSEHARSSELQRVQAALLAASRQRGDEADVRYASGLMSYDNWEIISSDRVSQERRELQTRLDAAAAQAAWERSLGLQLGE